jgi:hypothetical protein
MLYYEKYLKAIKTPKILHINLFGQDDKIIAAGSVSDPTIYYPIAIPELSKLSIDSRFKKVLKIIKDSYKLMCDYLETKGKQLVYKEFGNIYNKLNETNYNGYIPIHIVNVPKENHQLKIEISLLKKKVSMSFSEEDLFNFRINLVPYVYHPMDYFFFFKPFSFHSRKGNILSLKSKKILLCFNLINHNWFFKKRGKTPIPLDEKEELIFTFLDFEKDKQGYLSKCTELNDDEFIAYINDEIMTLMI